MTLPTAPNTAGTSTRPYLIRALHDWCTDNGYTPYIAVFVDASVRVPAEYVKNSEIVLNVGFEATTALQLGNDAIEFKARFGGSPREIVVPVTHVIAIYARENGQGMAFPAPSEPAAAQADTTTARNDDVSSAAPAARLTLAEAPAKAAAPRAARSNKSTAKPEAASPAVTSEGTDPLPEPAPPGRPALKRIK